MRKWLFQTQELQNKICLPPRNVRCTGERWGHYAKGPIAESITATHMVDGNDGMLRAEKSVVLKLGLEGSRGHGGPLPLRELLTGIFPELLPFRPRLLVVARV